MPVQPSMSAFSLPQGAAPPPSSSSARPLPRPSATRGQLRVGRPRRVPKARASSPPRRTLRHRLRRRRRRYLRISPMRPPPPPVASPPVGANGGVTPKPAAASADAKAPGTPPVRPRPKPASPTLVGVAPAAPPARCPPQALSRGGAARLGSRRPCATRRRGADGPGAHSVGR